MVESWTLCRLLAYLAVLAIAASGCGDASEQPTTSARVDVALTSITTVDSSPSGTTTTSAMAHSAIKERSSVKALVFDSEDSAYEFWASQAPHAIFETEVFTSFESMVDSASVIGVGRVRGIGSLTEDLPEEAGGPVSRDILQVEVLDVLLGTLDWIRGYGSRS